MAEPVAENLVDVAEAARLLGIHVNTVKRIPPAELPFVRLGTRGDRRYRPAHIRAYIEERTVRS